MSASSFLFSGSPPADINTTTSDTSALPAWYQEYLQGLMGTANSIAAQPYPQYTGPRLADFNPAQNNSFSMTDAMPGQTAGALNSAGAALNAAGAANIPGAAQPYIDQSTSFDPASALSPYNATASNYLGQAANTLTPGGINSYMSPYTNDVVQGLTNSANQNWNNNIMPAVNNEFIGSGQYASGRNAQVLGQAANNFQTNLDTSVANALESGYNTAGTLAGQQAGLLGAAANTSLSQGTAAAGAAGQQAGLLQNAGALAGTAQQQQGALNTAIGAANTSLANTQQNIGVQNAAAEQAVGNQQQAQTQSNLDLAYQDFQNQALWPQTQAGFMSSIIRGLPTPGTSSTTSTNGAQSPFATQTPSFANTLSSLTAGSAANVPGSVSIFAEGGRVQKFAGGGMPDAAGALPATGAPGLDPHMAQQILQLAMQRAPQAKAGGGRMHAPPPMHPQAAQQILKLALTRAPGARTPAAPMGVGALPGGPAPAIPAMGGGIPHLAAGGALRSYAPFVAQRPPHVSMPQGVHHYSREMGSPKTTIRMGALSRRF